MTLENCESPFSEKNPVIIDASEDFPALTTILKFEIIASPFKIGEDQIFYCLQRGISEEKAIGLIVNGYCKEVLNQLPMEFAVEAQKLLSISLEGSVG